MKKPFFFAVIFLLCFGGCLKHGLYYEQTVIPIDTQLDYFKVETEILFNYGHGGCDGFYRYETRTDNIVLKREIESEKSIQRKWADEYIKYYKVRK